MVERCAYLFLGGDDSAKRHKVESLKAQYLAKGPQNIDFEVVYADDKELSPPKLDEILSYFPTQTSQKRIVLIKNAEALNSGQRDVLLKRLKSPIKSLLVILDSLELDGAFVRQLEPFVKKMDFQSPKDLGVFDLTRAIVSSQTTKALRILNLLLKNRENPQSILGALFWQWDKAKDRLSLDKFKRGLKLLLDTDIRIKTGKLDEELALEMLVIRLSYLI